MENPQKKIITVIGPTATGKSDLAIYLAKKFGGEIISADSRQVYRGMNIGSGKITKAKMRGVRHYLLGVASPKTDFNVAKFKNLAEKALREIWSKGKLAIVCGGTGFWVDALLFDLDFPDVRANPALRIRLNKLSTQKLFEMLKKLAPDRAKDIDANNKRRLVRAIEIAKAGGTWPEHSQKNKYPTLWLGLDLKTEKLYSNIEKRLDRRLRAGMFKEVQRLHKSGVSWKRLENFGLEYRFCALHLQGKLDKTQMRELLLYAIKHYAKRQRTWFRRNKNIVWLDAANKNRCKKQAAALSKKFIG